MVCDLFDREMIKHGKGVRQDEALNNKLVISMVIVVDIGLL